MTKVLVLYYSTYGHIETMAEAIAEGARSAGAEVDIRRVPETVDPESAQRNHFKIDQAAPVATIDELPNYDAIIIGHDCAHSIAPPLMARRTRGSAPPPVRVASGTSRPRLSATPPSRRWMRWMRRGS